ncbi:protein cramped [Leptopilina heterotoma]|uniref:protein cramped n=1 Tax=Leptopilina heterotoma TaxID=63436 RepID=UPI001CA98351|nr:protein cramped [Leptopilina heterotoma]
MDDKSDEEKMKGDNKVLSDESSKIEDSSIEELKVETTSKNDDSNNQSSEIQTKDDNNSFPIPSCSTSTEIIKIPPDAKVSNVKIVRGTKRMRIDSADATIGDKKEIKEDDSEAKIMRSLKRSCELWSLEDKNTFFKALNEYGKDFDALQSYFLTQGKKRGLAENMIKNKEQIRHFYCRTWLKISKRLKFSEDVKKTTQELYGLINYGELRRKLPRMHDKVHMKLNELVYWGSTQVRLRGKTMRIKTPICRALRKLNQLEDWQEDIKLPPRVTIELRPGNNIAWWKVQASAMNPRVRTLVPIQRRLSSILTYLQQRWRPPKYRTSIIDENPIDESKESILLRVSPSEGCKISIPVINLGEYLTSNSVSFDSYEKRIGLKSSKVELLGSMQYIKGMGRKGVKKSKGDKKLTKLCEDHYTGADNNSDLDVPELGSLNFPSEKQSLTSDVKASAEHSIEPNRFPGRETIDRIRLGWNIEEANTITVGDLFLMFGRESKVTLEYWWESPSVDPMSFFTGKTKAIVTPRDDNVSLMLQKLLSIAKQSYGPSKGYEHTWGSSETVISSRVPSTKESTFRQPFIPQTYHELGTPDAFKTQLDKFKMRFHKKGRTIRQRNLIVQRVVPVASPEVLNEMPNSLVSGETIGSSEIALNNSVDESGGDTNLEANSSQVKHFLDVLQENPTKASTSIITSATKILKEGEHQWLNCEVADFSLSSFLGQLESPMKGSQRSQTEGPTVEDIRPPSDIVTEMQCLMGENGVDYMMKFANIASQMASSDNQKK